MSVFERLRIVRVILATGVALRAAAWGIAAAVSLFIGAALVDLAAPLSVSTRAVILVVALVGAVLVAIALCWRDRAVLAIDRVALWVEERFPSLEYRLVTAVETGNTSYLPAPATEPWTRVAWRRAARTLRAPLAIGVVAFVVLLLLPAGAVARMSAPHAGDALDGPGAGRGNRASRLSPLVADIAPPAYAGERASTVDEPTDLRALEGSLITFRGRGDDAGIVLHVGADSVAAVSRGGRWTATLRVTAKPVAAVLQDGGSRRIVAIEPILDNPPIVTLAAPAHDSVLRAATGRLPLAAGATDDIGIAHASFEYIISSGEGETFTFKSGTLGAVQPRGKTASLAATLFLDSLGLKPGDIVHLRAVARDANNVSGPGVGVSETRAIRIARPDEYDSVAVEAAAPSEAGKGLISQRMLIMLAEALQKKKRTIARAPFVAESRAIAVDQKKLRRSVGDVVFTRLGGDPNSEEASDESPEKAKSIEELLRRADSATNVSTEALDFAGDESPVVAVNKPLLEAYNAMWDASTHLELGEPDRALPFMRKALDAIQRARKAERLYLRGTPPRVVIDINKARLKGKDKGSSSVRLALTSADSATRVRAERFTKIVELSARNPQAAIDSLLILRVDALGEAPAFAAALSDAVKAMREGKNAEATTALARARRALAGSPVARDTLSRWGTVP